MKLTLCNLEKIKKLCMNNPNEVITIDDVNFCWVVEEVTVFGKLHKDERLRIELANGWETLYI